MGRVIQRFAANRHILCFQEVHGLEGEVLHHFEALLPRWKIFCSSSLDQDGLPMANAGGVVTAICPELAAQANFEERCLVPGRCVAVSILAGARVLTVLNLHNYGLQTSQVQFLATYLSSLAINIKVNPCARFGILVGDLNIKAENEKSFKVGRDFDSGARDRGYSNPLFSGHLLRWWGKIFEDWTELIQPFPTHYDHQHKTCSRIDRGWVLCPSSLLVKLRVMSYVVDTPEQCYAEGLSDHAPVVFSFSCQHTIRNASNSVPKFICKHPEFKIQLDALVEECKLFTLPNHKQLPVYKTCIKEAARKVRQLIHLQDDNSVQSRRLLLASISRAIWFNNVALAGKIIQTSQLGSDLLLISGRRVTCKDFVQFDDIFNQCHLDHHQRRVNQLRSGIAAAISINAKKQLKARMQAARRQQNVFWPTLKKLALTGIKIVGEDGSDSIITSPSSIQEALRNYWGQVYDKKEGDLDKANKLLGLYARRQTHLFNFANLQVPVEDDYLNTIARVKDSACGEDGIPYSAYKASPETSAKVMVATTEDLKREHPKSDLMSLNKQLVWFAPKGPTAQDNKALVRSPNNLRTIFGSNADSKLIAGTVAFQLVAPSLDVTPFIQRGFCRNRQLSLNIVDLDAYMRVFNIAVSRSFLGSSGLPDIGTIPATVLYDFCNAFPTVLHEWLFLVLGAYNVPLEIRNIILALYTCICAYSSGVGDGSLLFEVLGGVKTGCPLSSLLFLLCINPIVFLIQMLSDNPGFSITRVCADDFGSALRALNSLKTHASIFKLARDVAGLHLKPSKCVLIITCIKLDDITRFAIRNWLRENVPEFSEFLIQESGKYLGWHLGNNSRITSFKDPLVKYVNRVEEITGGKAPATTSLCRYNQRAVNVLSYVSQFSCPPESAALPALAQWGLHKILRMPPNSMSRQLCHSVSFCAVVDPIPLNAYCKANLFRFAHSERDYLLQLQAEISEIAKDDLPFTQMCKYCLPEGGLGSPPILEELIDAIHLEGNFKSIRKSCLQVPSFSWILNYPASTFPSKYKSLQSAALAVLSFEEKCGDLSIELYKKARVTLVPFQISCIPDSWFDSIQNCLSVSSIFVRMCWLKSISGGWCTSVRLHSLEDRGCIFGCSDSKDELCHYIICPVLWCFARDTLHVTESSVFVGHRLCIVDPTPEKLKNLAFCHSLYHACVNDSLCMRNDGFPRAARIVQSRASEVSRHCAHLVGGR